MKQNIIDKIFKALLALGLLAPVLVSKDYFFPYITPKAVFFRWIVFAGLLLFSYIFYQKKEIIYKTTKVWWAFLGLAIVYFLSAIFGTFFEKSFWSNIERADGVVLMWYLFVYFALLVFAFRKKVDWQWLWRLALGVCFYICGYGVLQHLGYIDILSSTGARIASTFGNPAYLGNYALMNAFLALYLIVGDKNRKWLFFYIPSFLLSTWSVFLTQTRGSILGLFGGLAIAFLLSIFFSKNKKVKKVSGAVLLVLAILGTTIFLARDTALVQKSVGLDRVTHISLDDYTTQTRLRAWQASFEGFKERPILGWGPENYAYVFNQNFPPYIYRDSGSKIWFDKAHSVFFEYLTTMGIVGTLTYLWLLFITCFLLWKSKNLNSLEKSVLIGLVFGYFFANMFVFDTLGTYLTLVLLLAFANNIASSKEGRTFDFEKWPSWVLIGLILVFVWLTYITNIEAVSFNKKLLRANRDLNEKGLTVALPGYQETVVDNNNFSRFELRQHFINFVSGNIKSLDSKARQESFDLAEQMAKSSIEEEPLQLRHYYNLFGFYMASADYYPDSVDKALLLQDKMLELGPTRAHTYYQLAEAYLQKEDVARAKEYFETAVSINPDVADAWFNVLAISVLSGDQDRALEAENNLDRINPNYLLDESNLIKMATIYQQVADLEGLTRVFEKMHQVRPDKPDYVYNLALAYANAGREEEAREVIIKLRGINSKIDQQVDDFLKNMAAGLFKTK